MKKFLLLPLLLIFIRQSALAFPFYDPFVNMTPTGTSYAVGSPLAGQATSNGDVWNSLGGNFPGAQPTIVAGNLTYPGMTAPQGNSVSFVPAASMSVRLNFNATIASGPAYYSFLLKITDLTAVPTNAANNFFACFSDGSAGQVQQLARAGTRLLTKKVGTNYVLGVGRNSVLNDFVYDTTQHSVGEVVLVVGSYELVNGVTNVYLWINPSQDSLGAATPPTPTVSVVNFSSTTGNLNASGVLGFCILCQNTTAPSGIIDDVRIATDWSTVTGGDPAITAAPVSQTAPPGADVTFNVEARGTPTLTYQWLKDGVYLDDFSFNVTGSQTSTLTVHDISATDTATYSVTVENGLGNLAVSTGATLTVLTDPLITNQPQNVTTNFGSTATFQVTATGTAPLTYQWHKDGSDLADGGNISGSQTDTLLVSNLTTADAGNYSVTVSNALGISANSASASLTVNDPYISVQPVPVSGGAGSTANFQVTAVGTGPFSYQWFKNGSYLFDIGNASGTSTSNLVLSAISSTDQANYTVTVSGPYGSVTSSAAALTVLSPVSIAFPPNPRTVAPGVRTILVVGATGSAPISYQWLKDGVNISNATSATYVVASAQAGDAGNYTVAISNSFSSITSAPVALAVSSTLTLARTNLEIIRVGDGAQTLTLNGNSLFLDQYTTNGNYVNTVTIPDNGPSAIIAMGPNNANGGNSGGVTGSSLTRSLDGRFLVMAGYNTNVGYGASLKDSLYTAIPRGIATVDSHAQYSLPVADTNYAGFTQSYWRSGVTDGTNNFWGAASAPGTYYFGFDDAPALVQTNFINPRNMGLFNGSIYCVSAVASANGVLKLNGMPRTADTPVLLFATSSTGSSDLEVSPDGNLIYVADDRASTAGGGVQRWQFDGSSWSLAYTITNNLPHGVRYLTADFSVTPPVVYAIGKEITDDNDRLVIIPDTGVNSTCTTVTYSGVNQTFRGIRFGPIENTVITRPVLAFTFSDNNLVLTWSGAFTLQSATDAAGPYTDVADAVSPYSVNVSSAAKLFFRLRH